MRRTRLMALLFGVLLITVLLSSVVIAAVEAEHECTGEHCPVCHWIDVCENALKQLSFVLVAAFATAMFLRLVPLCAVWRRAGPGIRFNPVTLKVKLSN